MDIGWGRNFECTSMTKGKCKEIIAFMWATFVGPECNKDKKMSTEKRSDRRALAWVGGQTMHCPGLPSAPIKSCLSSHPCQCSPSFKPLHYIPLHTLPSVPGQWHVRPPTDSTCCLLAYSSTLYIETDSRFLHNIRKLLPGYTMSHTRWVTTTITLWDLKFFSVMLNVVSYLASNYSVCIFKQTFWETYPKNIIQCILH
jgi:hypothetical protein